MDDKVIEFKNSSFVKGLDGSGGKVKIGLGISYEIKQNDGLIYIELNLFIGIDKLYKINDYDRFLNSLINLNSLYFGKKFILEPTKMYFKPVDRAIINLLIKIKNNKGINSIYTFDSNGFVLKNSDSSDFLDIIFEYGNKLNFYNQPELYKFDKDLNLNIKIDNENNYYLLKVDYTKYGCFKPIDAGNFKYLFFDNKNLIIQLPENKRQLVKNLYYSDNNNSKLVFKLNERELKLFKDDFYDKYSGNNEIKIDNKLKEKIDSFNLISRVYFDMNIKGIVSKAEFCYGDIIINPCDDNGSHKEIRDMDKEREVVYEIKNYGMNAANKLFYLHNAEKIMDLLTDDLQRLKKIAKVYYSEDFKKMHVTNLSNLGMSIGLSEDESMLCMNINLENVSDEELVELLEAIKQKKRYYRLKNGSIINLSNVESDQLADFINNLDIDISDISNNQFNIPVNRCLFIENYLKEKGLTDVKIDTKLADLMDDMASCKEEELNISDYLMRTLREYQLTGVKWIKGLSKYAFGGILADDMGLGKTLQVLSFIDSEKERTNPCIVIAPTSLVYNWKVEANKFVPHLKVLIVCGNKEKRNMLLIGSHNYDILVTSYGLIKNDLEEYKKIKFLYVFVDEAQHIKNPKTLNANSVKKLNARACFALTGTPIENGLTELWSIFDFVMPGYLYDYKNFKKNFEEPIMNDINSGAVNDLSQLTKPFILRRLKKHVLAELPEKIESNCITELTIEQKKIYTAYYKKFKKELENTLSEENQNNNIEILALLTRLRQISSHPGCFIKDYNGGSGKLDLAVEIIEDSISGGHSIILFSQFTKILKLIRSEMEKRNLNYYYLDGKISAEDRMVLVENFNADREAVFLISLKAGGTGLNLTKADIVIHFDPWWNPAVENQASDRVYRIGQRNAVQVYRLIAEGTIEEKILDLHDRKKDLIDSVIKPGESFLNKMSKEDIIDLFELENL